MSVNVDTIASREKLGRKPADMPDRGGPKPNAQIAASTVPLSRTENPVAARGDSRGPGTVQKDGSTHVDLSRTANCPYEKEQMSETKKQYSFLTKKIKISK